MMNGQNSLTTEQFNVLRKVGTEPPNSLELLNEKRKGVFACRLVIYRSLNLKLNMNPERVGRVFIM